MWMHAHERSHKKIGTAANDAPATSASLHLWLRTHLRLRADQEQALLAAVDSAFRQRDEWWRQSKEDGIRAVRSGLTRRLAAARRELQARETAAAAIVKYFEDLVEELTDRADRDPKTRLLNFQRFTEQLERFLAIEQRGRWCAVGLVDINSFKWYNDTLGHITGDLVIHRVATILQEQVRSGDFLGRDLRHHALNGEMHARFGGDEFCFLISELTTPDDAAVIARRFRQAVERYPWHDEDSRLASRPVSVDVGVVSLLLESARPQPEHVGQIATSLVTLADGLMYEAKAAGTGFTDVRRVRLVGQTLEPIGPPRSVG
jgi:diguanylate cyclase (GGDEF)-like protein